MTPSWVFLHGIGSNASAFTEVTARLGGEVRCIAWNAPGYLGSAPLPIPRPTVGDYVASLLELLEGFGPYHLIGSSLGALIATAVAATHPEKVVSLLLTAPVTGSGRSPETRRAELQAREALIALGPERMAEVRAPQLVAGSDPEVLRSVREATRALDPAAYLQAAHALAHGDIFTYTPSIEVPTVVVCGTADTVAPADRHARPIAQAISGAELVLVPGRGHLIELEAPDVLAGLIRRRVPSTPPPGR